MIIRKWKINKWKWSQNLIAVFIRSVAIPITVFSTMKNIFHIYAIDGDTYFAVFFTLTILQLITWALNPPKYQEAEQTITEPIDNHV